MLDWVEVNVYGTKDKRKIAAVKEAVNFYAARLMPQWVIRDLDIIVEFDKDLANHAHCIPTEDDYNPRAFQITYNPQCGEGIIELLAHEMVHVKQYAMDELRTVFAWDRDEAYIWQGERFRLKDDENIDLDSPWEIEAYGREIGLIDRWKNRKRKKS